MRNEKQRLEGGDAMARSLDLGLPPLTGLTDPDFLATAYCMRLQYYQAWQEASTRKSLDILVVSSTGHWKEGREVLTEAASRCQAFFQEYTEAAYWGCQDSPPVEYYQKYYQRYLKERLWLYLLAKAEESDQ